MAQSKPILFSFFRSSCSWRVRIALAFKGIDYEYRTVNLRKNEHLTEDFKNINPSAEVPVFVDKGNVLCQSAAILEYLEETTPTPALLPADPVKRAQVRALVCEIVGGIQPLQNLRVLQRIADKDESWGRYWIEHGFTAIEQLLKKWHGLYCVGDEITLADICLVPQVLNANRFLVDMSKFPLIREISSRLSEVKEFKDTHPFVQPDCPDELRKK